MTAVTPTRAAALADRILDLLEQLADVVDELAALAEAGHDEAEGAEA